MAALADGVTCGHSSLELLPAALNSALGGDTSWCSRHARAGSQPPPLSGYLYNYLVCSSRKLPGALRTPLAEVSDEAAQHAILLLIEASLASSPAQRSLSLGCQLVHAPDITKWNSTEAKRPNMRIPLIGKRGENFKLEREYEIENEIGRGAYGVVYEVHKKGEEQGVPTAVKILPLSKSKIPFKELKTRLTRLKELNDARYAETGGKDEHVLRMLDFRMTSDTAFVFIEYCAGGDMLERLLASPNERATEEQARATVYTLLAVLAGLHRGNMVHRDVKPDNIFYRSADAEWHDLVLADFGCFTEGQPGEEFEGVIGTPEYASPEMLSGHKHNSKTDIWSAGVTAFMMLTGRLPWISVEACPLNDQIVKRPISYTKSMWRHVSPEAQDCIRCMLERDPVKRWSAAELLAHPWFASIHDPAVNPSDPVSPEQLEQTKSRIEAISYASDEDDTRSIISVSEAREPRSTVIRTDTLLRGEKVESDLRRRLSKLGV